MRPMAIKVAAEPAVQFMQGETLSRSDRPLCLRLAASLVRGGDPPLLLRPSETGSREFAAVATAETTLGRRRVAHGQRPVQERTPRCRRRPSVDLEGPSSRRGSCPRTA